MYKYCSQPYDTVSIKSTGDVYPCICPGYHSYKPIGNIKTQSLFDIFNNSLVKDFRNTVVDQSYKNCKPNCGTILETVDNFPPIVTQQNLIPRTVMLGIDQNCNLKCGSCRTKNIYSPDVNPNTMLILDRLNEFYKDYTETVFIRGDGSGDLFSSAAWQQFLMKPDLAECFRFQFLTNGNLITKNIDIIEKIRSKIDTFEITFDAATPETYTVVRGGKFQSIIDGAKALYDLGITVQGQYVTQQANYHEILDYCKLAKELGVNHISLNTIFRWGHMSDEWWNANKLHNNPNIDYEFFVSTLEHIHENNLGYLNNVLLNIVKDYRSK